MAKSIKKNFIYNLSYQILGLLTPLIVTPYVSRVLDVEGVGLYSYANSIVSYFLLVAVLGTATYGQRAISYVQQEVEERSRAFWEVFIVRLLTSLITLAAYGIYVLVAVPQNELAVYLILALNIINVIFDISWFMQGLEEFGKTALRSIIFRILSIASIFIFVKSPSHLYLYVIFMVAYTVVGNMSLWLYLPKYLCRVKGIKPFKDIKSILQLFIPTVAIQIYTVLDKSMIGWLTDGYTENGYYEQAEKIVKVALTAVTALGIVMIPRIARTYKEGNIEKVNSYMYRSYRFVWMMSIPVMLGFIAISSTFVPVYYGAYYSKCAVLIPVFSALTVLIGLSNVTGIQYLIPIGKQNVLTLTVVIGAVVNFALNMVLIRYFSSVGAAIASITAELCVTAAGFIYIKKTKRFALKPVFTCCWKYWIAGGVMFGLLWLAKIFLPITLWALVLLILTGVTVYFVALLILRDKFLLELMSKGIKMLLKPFKRKNKEKNMYDYLVVGAGLYGAVFAHEAKQRGKKVLVIDKRPNIAGNVYTEEIECINVHKYGAHIFHTNNREVWDYVNKFAEFNRFTNSPVANYKGELYSLPFNMYTFNKMWGVTAPEEAQAKIEEQRKASGIKEPENLEEQAISLVGKDIYEKLVKGYTEKQWGRPCTELPAFIIKRLPVRFTFDNNYFNALYQGIPIGGYTKMVENMLDGIDVRLNCDYLEHKPELDKLAKKVIYTGPIDAYFGFKLGALEYRSVRFETEVLDKPNFQGNAAVNYTDSETPWTRIIEHKWFEFGTQPKTVISREYSSEWKQGDEPYYPVNDEKNGALYAQYRQLAENEQNVVFGGRLGEYKYYDMDAVIASALEMCKNELK